MSTLWRHYLSMVTKVLEKDEETFYSKKQSRYHANDCYIKLYWLIRNLCIVLGDLVANQSKVYQLSTEGFRLLYLNWLVVS